MTQEGGMNFLSHRPMSNITEGDEQSSSTHLLAEDSVEEEQQQSLSPPQHDALPQSLSTDEDGEPKDSLQSILLRMTSLVVAGTIIGLLSNKSSDLIGTWYPTLSACVGYTYFLMWSVSFYPQLVSNFQRRTTVGLSADFATLNVLGFACYAAYNIAFFSSSGIHKQYKERYPNSEITVQSNDVAFAVHALVISSLTLLQIGYYDGFRSQRPSKVISTFIAVILGCITVYPVALFAGFGSSLDYLYLLSYVKMAVSLIKYIPQVVLNFQRKSTAGWSIWQILLDLSGGLLSDMQLVLDCWDVGDWSGITGNVAKFFLGSISIFFDIIFMLQHYVLYSTPPLAVVPVTEEREEQALLPVDLEEQPDENEEGTEGQDSTII